MSRKRIAILSIVLVAAIGAVAVAQKVAHAGMMHEGMMHDGMTGEHMTKFLAYHLDLNDQQKQQVQTIFDNEKPKLDPLMKELGDAHHQLQALTDAGTFDEGQARSIVEAHKEAFIQMLAEHAKIHSQIMAVLTPEQQAKFKTLHQGHGDHMHGDMAPQQQPTTK